MKDSEITLNAVGIRPNSTGWRDRRHLGRSSRIHRHKLRAASFLVVHHREHLKRATASLASIQHTCPSVSYPPFGVLADRYNRKVIMIISDGAVGLISSDLVFAILAGSVNIPLLLLFTIARATARRFTAPP